MKKLKALFIKNKDFLYFLIILFLLLMLLVLSSLYAVELYNNKDKDVETLNYSQISMVQSLQAQNDIVNLASPDLIGKEYLGNGIYKIQTTYGVTLTYNVYTGIYNMNGLVNNTTDFWIYRDLNLSGVYAISIDYLTKMPVTLYFTSTDLLLNYFGYYGGYYENIQENGFNDLFVYLTIGQNINIDFKLQIEQGTIPTSYQTPIGALKQHSQLEYDRGYNIGYDGGNYSGFVDGKNEIYNNILNVISYDKFEVFNNGFDLIYRLDFINVFGNDLLYTDNLLDIIDSIYADKKYQLYNIYIPNNYYLFLPHDNGLIANGLKVNFIQVTNKNSKLRISFFNKDNEPIQTEFYSDIKRSYEYIYIQYNTNTSIMDNAPIYNEGYENGYKDGSKLSNQVSFNEGLKEGFNKGYNKGLIDGASNPNSGWQDLLFTIFGAFGTILAIEILPGWSIGVIVGIPIVFGIIYFIIGRKRD